MIPYGTSFPNCSRRCQTHAVICGRVMILVESSAPLQMKGCQEVECAIAVKPTIWHCCHGTVTGMLLHSLYVNLLLFYHWLLSVPANHNWDFFYESALWYCFYEANVWSACLSLIFCKFVRGAARFLVGALHPLATPWLQAC